MRAGKPVRAAKKPDPACPKCGSLDVSETGNVGEAVEYDCQQCGKAFQLVKK